MTFNLATWLRMVRSIEMCKFVKATTLKFFRDLTTSGIKSLQIRHKRKKQYLVLNTDGNFLHVGYARVLCVCTCHWVADKDVETN